MNMLITVITLTYKSEYEILFRTIESTLEQNYSRIELIIADDGTDGFDKEYVKKYIRDHKSTNLHSFSVLSKIHNEGTVKNYKDATNAANGDVIVNLSCGDFFYSRDVLEKIATHYQNKDCLFLATRRLVCDKNEKPQFYWPHLLDKKLIDKLKTNKDQYLAFVTDRFYDFASGSSISYRKSILEEYPIDCNYKLLEDMPLFTKFTWNNRIEYDHELISIKYTLGGVSNSYNPILYQDLIYYNEDERMKNMMMFSKIDQRRIQYIVDKYNSVNRIKKIILILKYPIITLEWWIIRKRSIINTIVDKFFIRFIYKIV